MSSEISLSASKAMTIFTEMCERGEPCTLAELVRATGYPRTVTNRMVATLVHHGFIDRHDESGLYSVSPLSLHMVNKAFRSDPLLTRVEQMMRQIVNRDGGQRAVHDPQRPACLRDPAGGGGLAHQGVRLAGGHEPSAALRGGADGAAGPLRAGVHRRLPERPAGGADGAYLHRRGQDPRAAHPGYGKTAMRSAGKTCSNTWSPSARPSSTTATGWRGRSAWETSRSAIRRREWKMSGRS